jgi:chorismate mutase
MSIRGIRGAVIASENNSESILTATTELLIAIQKENPDLRSDDIASAIFTMTEDLDAAYPAQAARQLGWGEVPLFCAQEIPVPGSLQRCIRVLLHWNTEHSQKEVQHVYLGRAAQLRPDLTSYGK